DPFRLRRHDGLPIDATWPQTAGPGGEPAGLLAWYAGGESHRTAGSRASFLRGRRLFAPFLGDLEIEPLQQAAGTQEQGAPVPPAGGDGRLHGLEGRMARRASGRFHAASLLGGAAFGLRLGNWARGHALEGNGALRGKSRLHEWNRQTQLRSRIGKG